MLNADRWKGRSSVKSTHTHTLQYLSNSTIKWFVSKTRTQFYEG